MNQLSSPPVRNVSTSQLVSIVFACLSYASFLIGSILICLVWLTPKLFGISSYYNEEDSFITTIFNLVPMLVLFWLFGTVALLTARRWVIAALLIPVTVVLFIGIYLFLTLMSYHVSGGPKIAFVLLFVPLDIVIFVIAWRLMLASRN